MTSARWIAVGVLIGCTLRPPAASAQQPDTLALRSAVGATSPTTVIRVELLDARLLTGAFLGAEETGFELSVDGAPPLRVPYTDVARYWERGRSVRPGLITGGILGAGVGAFIGALLAATCETCTEDPSPAAGALQGGLVVGALGAGAGAIIGAAIPRWSLRWPSGAASRPAAAPPRAPVGAPPPTPPVAIAGPATAAGSPPQARETGEFTLQLGVGYGGSEGEPSPPFPGPAFPFPTQEGPMLGALASLSFRLGIVAFGPEIGWFVGTPGVATFTGLTRLDLRGRNTPIAPYAIVGLGGYAWQGDLGADETLLTVPLGVGVTLGADRRWRAEARWHQLVHRGSIGRPALLTISAGRRFVW